LLKNLRIDIELNCPETNDFNFSGLAQVKSMASKHSIWMMYSTADMFVMSGCLWESRVSRWFNCLLNEHQMTRSHHQMANVIRTSFTSNLSLLRFILFIYLFFFFRNNWTVITVKYHAEYPNIIRLTSFQKRGPHAVCTLGVSSN